jgi:hypothetical protein
VHAPRCTRTGDWRGLAWSDYLLSKLYFILCVLANCRSAQATLYCTDPDFGPVISYDEGFIDDNWERGLY